MLGGSLTPKRKAEGNGRLQLALDADMSCVILALLGNQDPQWTDVGACLSPRMQSNLREVYGYLNSTSLINPDACRVRTG